VNNAEVVLYINVSHSPPQTYTNHFPMQGGFFPPPPQ